MKKRKGKHLSHGACMFQLERIRFIFSEIMSKLREMKTYSNVPCLVQCLCTGWQNCRAVKIKENILRNKFPTVLYSSRDNGSSKWVNNGAL